MGEWTGLEFSKSQRAVEKMMMMIHYRRKVLGRKNKKATPNFGFTQFKYRLCVFSKVLIKPSDSTVTNRHARTDREFPQIPVSEESDTIKTSLKWISLGSFTFALMRSSRFTIVKYQVTSCLFAKPLT